MRGWLEVLPDELIRARPVLSVAYAWALLVSGELDGVQTRLDDAERRLGATPTARGPREAPSTGIVVDEDEFRRLPGAIAVLRAACAQAVGDVAETMKHARRVLDVAADDDDLLRGSAAGFLGLAYWTSGDLEAGHQMYAECAARPRSVLLRRVELVPGPAGPVVHRPPGHRRGDHRRPDLHGHHDGAGPDTGAVHPCHPAAGRAARPARGRLMHGHERLQALPDGQHDQPVTSGEQRAPMGDQPTRRYPQPAGRDAVRRACAY